MYKDYALVSDMFRSKDMHGTYDRDECRVLSCIDDSFDPETAEIVHRYSAACGCDLPEGKAAAYYADVNVLSRARLLGAMFRSMCRAKHIALGTTAEKALASMALSEIILKDAHYIQDFGVIVPESSLCGTNPKKAAALFKLRVQALCYAAVRISVIAFERMMEKQGRAIEKVSLEETRAFLKAELDGMNIKSNTEVFYRIYLICRKNGFYTGAEHMPAGE